MRIENASTVELRATRRPRFTFAIFCVAFGLLFVYLAFASIGPIARAEFDYWRIAWMPTWLAAITMSMSAVLVLAVGLVALRAARDILSLRPILVVRFADDHVVVQAPAATLRAWRWQITAAAAEQVDVRYEIRVVGKRSRALLRCHVGGPSRRVWFQTFRVPEVRDLDRFAAECALKGMRVHSTDARA